MKRLLNITLAGLLLIFSFHGISKVTIFAAASLTNAIDEIAQQYQSSKHQEVSTVFASSSTLARQIEQLSPADIFISADQNWMDYLQEKNLITIPTRMNLLTNSLVVISAKNSSIDKFKIDKSTNWLKLLNNGLLAVGDPDHVPAGIYARQALTYLDSYQSIENKLARADNVRSALMLVEQQESPLGIVYLSDALASTEVKIVATFPDESHSAIEYPMAIIANHSSKSVNDFYQYLKSEAAAKIFQKYGFELYKK